MSISCTGTSILCSSSSTSSVGQQLIQLIPPELLSAPAEGQSPLCCCHHLWGSCAEFSLGAVSTPSSRKSKEEAATCQTQGQVVPMQQQRQGTIPCLTLNRCLIQWPLTAPSKHSNLSVALNPLSKTRNRMSVCASSSPLQLKRCERALRKRLEDTKQNSESQTKEKGTTNR